MPRQKITTNYTPRNKINTEYTKRIGVASDLGYLETQLGFLATNNGDTILFHTGIFEKTTTDYIRKRYDSYIQDMQGIQVKDLEGELVLGISGKEVNKIQTIYT